jgi:carboxyl-terminal processing protease
LKIRDFRAVLAGALLCGACTTSAAPPPAPQPRATPIDTDLALLTFDSAWSRIANTHYDTAFAGVDWHGVREELRPRAAVANSREALLALLQEMVGRLGESHFGILPREVTDVLALSPAGAAAVSGDPGLGVRLVDDQVIVTHVDDGSAAADAGIRTGWVLVSIDGQSVTDRLARLAQLPEAEQRRARTRLLYALHGELSGEVDRAVEVVLRDGSDRELTRRLTLRPTRGEVVHYGNLPPVAASLQYRELSRAGGCVGVIRMNVWFGPLAAPFDAAVDALRHCRGMVIDMRGNPGGVAGLVMGVAGHFLADTATLGIMRTRTNELRFRASPRRVSAGGRLVEPFAGAVAVLTDEMTGSTAEFFAAGLQAIGRARVFGTPSAGQALPANVVRLPTGDVLMHVIADFTGPRGVRIEGRGVIPDVDAPHTRRDLLAGRDAALDAALDWIAGVSDAGLPQQRRQ